MATRRANHEGTRPAKVAGRDLWRVQVMVAGTRRAVYGPSPEVARDAARRLVRELETGVRPARATYTVGDWLRDWLALYTGGLRPRTRQSYADTVRLYIDPAIGRIRLAKLHQDDVVRMLRDAKGPRRELSPTTRRYIYAVLRIALGEAVRQDRLARNVATLIDPPSRAPKPVAALGADTVAALNAALLDWHPRGTQPDPPREHPHRAMILTALTAGLREGELLGLTWRAVDLDAASLEVRGQLDRGTGLVTAAKRDSQRRVDLPAVTVEALRAHRARQNRDKLGRKDWDPRGFVFTTPAGGPHTAGMPRRVLRSVLASLSLPTATTHQLRHTWVSMLLEAGTPLAVVSKLAGHKSVATTADVYGHLTDVQRRDAADRMAEQLRRKAK